jgi:hypothetical protein
MALSKKEETKAVETDNRITLVLALYKRYNFQGNYFESGVKYKFEPDVAVELLSHTDHGRAIWKRWHPAPPKPVAKKKVESDGSVDMSKMDLKHVPDEPQNAFEDGKKKILEVGNDEEIADILAAAKSEEDETI